MVHDPVLCPIRRFRERGMSRSEYPRTVVPLEYGVFAFGPTTWNHGISTIFECQHPQAIVGGPAPAGGVDDKHFSVSFEDLGTFIHCVAVLFPNKSVWKSSVSLR